VGEEIFPAKEAVIAGDLEDFGRNRDRSFGAIQASSDNLKKMVGEGGFETDNPEADSRVYWN